MEKSLNYQANSLEHSHQRKITQSHMKGPGGCHCPAPTKFSIRSFQSWSSERRMHPGGAHTFCGGSRGDQLRGRSTNPHCPPLPLLTCSVCADLPFLAHSYLSKEKRVSAHPEPQNERFTAWSRKIYLAKEEIFQKSSFLRE